MLNVTVGVELLISVFGRNPPNVSQVEGVQRLSTGDPLGEGCGKSLAVNLASIDETVEVLTTL